MEEKEKDSVEETEEEIVNSNEGEPKNTEENIQDYKTMYEDVLAELQALKGDVESKKRLSDREKNFEESGLKKNRYSMYHKLADSSEDWEVEFSELSKNFPEDFETKESNIRDSFYGEKQIKNKEKDEEEKINEQLKKAGKMR